MPTIKQGSEIMKGVLDGLRVLDLSWGIAGPVAGMLLADHGATVTKIESPEGDPFRNLSGYRVWSRGKRSVVLDLKSEAGLKAFQVLVGEADVLLESFSPGVTQRLGIDYDTLAEVNPRLIYCSITGYGDSGKHAERPAYDALIAARTGQQWEHRGLVGSTIARLSGGKSVMPGFEPPDEDCWVGPPRHGPLFSGVPWTSMATAYLATLGINTALRVREKNGFGQQVRTSMLQGVLVNTAWSWLRVERPDEPRFLTWFNDPRTPKGFYRASDGRWTQHWPTMPGFILSVSEGGQLGLQSESTEEQDTPRWNQRWPIELPENAKKSLDHGQPDAAILQYYNRDLQERVARFPADEWVKLAAEFGLPVQPVRSPEEALCDKALQEDGCVIGLDDPELGKVLQVGRVYSLSECPTDVPGNVAAVGEHTDQVLEQLLDQPKGKHPKSKVNDNTLPQTSSDSLAAPLEGIRVLDLGLAVAGPFCTQLLSDLGAEVIKINTLQEGPWFDISVAMCANRGKRSIALDLKQPEGMEVFLRLVATADVVQHNMRYDAAKRLGLDYESLKKVKPDLIYSLIRGFEYGPRAKCPGNDQVASALAGPEWLDGGVENGGRAFFSLCSLGDTGTGLLSAIGIVQALYHRDRTGLGQFVDASIINTHLLNSSMSWVAPDSNQQADRQRVDAMQLGWNALYRLYKTAEGWLCLAVLYQSHWEKFCEAINRKDLTLDTRFADKEARQRNDSDLVAELDAIFATKSAKEWLKLLDANNVPAEVSSPDFVLGLFDDPEFIDKGWVTSYTHDKVGRMDVSGKLIDFSKTPGIIQGPPPVVGAHSRDILTELSYSVSDIDAMIEAKVTLESSS